MKHLYRMIFWGLIMVICIVAGVLGISQSNQNFAPVKNKLNSIVYNFNNNENVKAFNDRGITLNAKLKGRKIVITYDSTKISKYTYSYKDGYLETTFDSKDSFGTTQLMIMAASIGDNFGINENDIYGIITSNSYLNYTLDSGIEAKLNNGKYTIKLNVESPITINGSTL